MLILILIKLMLKILNKVKIVFLNNILIQFILFIKNTCTEHKTKRIII
jgi:hypothetical protein